MRFIGMTHRVKRTAEGESRPTMVAIIDQGKVAIFELATEQDELDFVLGQFPIAWRDATADDIVPPSKLHQVKWKPIDAGQSMQVPAYQLETRDRKTYRIHKVPSDFDGLQKSDVVAMTLGGSGDYLAYALARQSDNVGATVLRIPPFALKQRRDEATGEKEGDEVLLATLAANEPGLFYPLASRDRDLIVARESWRALSEAMQARIACEQRLRQSFIGKIFTSSDGLFPEGGVEKAFDSAKASNVILKALLMEEGEREKELAKALAKLDIYTKVLSPITGVGPKIAARIIAAVVDIRRFAENAAENAEVLIAESYARSAENARLASFVEDASKTGRERYSRINDLARIAKENGEEDKARHLYALLHEKKVRGALRRKPHQQSANNLKAFMGVHLLPDGTFPRKRRGAVANWHGDARQALYLMMDQFFKRPDSEWGKRLRAEMVEFRRKHPEVVMSPNATGKMVKKYNDLHIRKMAMWRTATKFVEWLYIEWNKLEPAPAKALPAERKAA